MSDLSTEEALALCQLGWKNEMLTRRALESQLAASQERERMLRDALQCYAIIENWDCSRCLSSCKEHTRPHLRDVYNLDDDASLIARTALAQTGAKRSADAIRVNSPG